MLELGLVIADEHLDSNRAAHESYELVRKFAREYTEWTWVVDLGDLLELPYLASFNAEAVEVMSEGRFQDDYDLAREHIEFFRGVCDEYVLLQGNHDERVDRFLTKYPFCRGVVDYKRAFEGVEFWPMLEQPYRRGKLNFVHGWWATKYSGAAALEDIGGNVIAAHWHKFQTISKVVPAKREEIQAWMIGCLCGKLPRWKKGRPSGWQNGFAVVEMDGETGRFNVYPVNIINNEFIYDGHLWKL